VSAVRIAVSLIGSDLHRLNTLLAELLDDWELQSVRLARLRH
jgi:hypothetical protein